jgi:hypothetical protein
MADHAKQIAAVARVARRRMGTRKPQMSEHVDTALVGQLGVAQAALEYSTERTQCGVPIASKRLVQELLADSAVDNESALQQASTCVTPVC